MGRGATASGAARLGALPGTHADLDCVGLFAQTGIRIDEAGEMMTRIEQTGE